MNKIRGQFDGIFKNEISGIKLNAVRIANKLTIHIPNKISCHAVKWQLQWCYKSLSLPQTEEQIIRFYELHKVRSNPFQNIMVKIYGFPSIITNDDDRTMNVQSSLPKKVFDCAWEWQQRRNFPPDSSPQLHYCWCCKEYWQCSTQA